MKRILVAGKGSYIGNYFKNYIESASSDFIVDELDTIGFDPETCEFDQIDTIVYVAGIAHIKETKENRDLYYKVNRDLTLEVAKKAKEQGVKQFVFLSTMSVYGMESGVITNDTKPAPKNSYGESKLQAEELLDSLNDESFKVVVLRPPMVYGKGCKGNFQTVLKIVDKIPVFPKINNRRSMIYIDNLCEFIKLCVEQERQGLYFPQNREYVNTSDMAKVIADEKGKKVFFSKVLGFGVCLLRPFVSMANKAFGNLTYEGTEKDDFSYCVVDETQSFKRSI